MPSRVSGTLTTMCSSIAGDVVPFAHHAREVGGRDLAAHRPLDDVADLLQVLPEIAGLLREQRRVGRHAVEDAERGDRLDVLDAAGVDEELHGGLLELQMQDADCRQRACIQCRLQSLRRHSSTRFDAALTLPALIDRLHDVNVPPAGADGVFEGGVLNRRRRDRLERLGRLDAAQDEVARQILFRVRLPNQADPFRRSDRREILSARPAETCRRASCTRRGRLAFEREVARPSPRCAPRSSAPRPSRCGCRYVGSKRRARQRLVRERHRHRRCRGR